MGDQEKKSQKDTSRSSRASGKSRQSSSRLQHQSSRSSGGSGRSPTSSSRRQINGNQASDVSSKRRSSRSPKPESGTSQSRHRSRSSGTSKDKKTRSSSVDDVRPLDPNDAWSLAMAQSDKKNKKKSKPSRSLSFDDTLLVEKDEVAEMPSSLDASMRSTGGRGKSGHHKSKSSRSINSSEISKVEKDIKVDKVKGGSGANVFIAKTFDEAGEANHRARIQQLEDQNNKIKKKLSDAMEKKGAKNSDMGQEAVSNKGGRLTICKVIGVAAIYLAGVATGFLVSELRPRRAAQPSKEIYITQSPTAATYPSIAPTEFSYEEPTPEDCFAIESKEEVSGQDGMITKSFDVHFDVQLTGSSGDWYEQLEEGVTDIVVPELACCNAPAERRLFLESEVGVSMIRGGNRMLRNIRCVVANGSTRGEGTGNGGGCVELTGFCVPAVVTFDLALKGDEANSDIMDLVRNVINGDGSEPLVEKFDLERNVFSVVKLVDVVPHDPTDAPTASVSPTSPSPTLSPPVTSAPVISRPTGPSPETPRPTFAPTKTSAPVVGPTTNSTTRPPTSRPTPRLTSFPTLQPAPGVTLRPTPSPTPTPSAQPVPSPTLPPTPPPAPGPSPAPTESPSSSPTLVPTLVASSAPTTSSPTTSMPSITPSSSPTGRREILEEILTPVVSTIDSSSLDWLADTDTWSPPEAEADPDTMWVERYALVTFYEATNGDTWTDQGEWMTSASVCDWVYGICNASNRIQQINLAGNGLSGTINTEIGLLRDLESCDLSDNGIGGALPTEIGLPKLKNLDIANNSVTGRIPSEIGLTAMISLDISSNQCSGPIPSEVLSMDSLKDCHFQENSLTGTIGSDLGAGLRHVNLRSNQISGSLPTELGSLPDLALLSTRDCSLSGAIPSELGRATKLGTLDLENNNLISGTIPTTLGQLTMLTEMYLDNTNVNGPVPSELGRLIALTTLRLENSDLMGSIPSELNLLTALQNLDLANTQVSGSIPDLSALVNLQTLDFTNCQLTGRIPPNMFNNMLNLEVIIFARNSLTGSIPAVPNPSLLRTCKYNGNCFSDLTNAGTCDLTNNCA